MSLRILFKLLSLAVAKSTSAAVLRVHFPAIIRGNILCSL